ncbi:restriction endonuclease [Rufibacter sediminis]|uniref:Restriction endonuclease n=1 Tax=Rufibacter sediminis TaxID=2762756 RepID=A0ABR6VWJ5_9BACT|nr:restriction endonuclease [Rufibacter sediminis]MBC3541299.1 restriction endonuclease [Rufibacter sediminis]
MAIPDYQTIMLPLLKFASDGKEHKTREAVEALATYFNLSQEDLTELLPSGTQPTFSNRVGWATTYLKKAGLLESSKKSYFNVTERGRKVLAQNPPSINVKFLNQFPEFIDFKLATNSNGSGSAQQLPITESTATPEEILENAYQGIRQELVEEILTKIKALTPAFFEKLVVQLLVKMGYGGSFREAGKALGKSGDGGIDGIIKEDILGLDVIYIQAKRWDNNPVGRPDIQSFVGALAGQGAKKGVFITTSRFSTDAIAYTPRNETKIVLIDGQQLAQYMIDYNLGVSVSKSYEVKKLDLDFFEEE